MAAELALALAREQTDGQLNERMHLTDDGHHRIVVAFVLLFCSPHALVVVGRGCWLFSSRVPREQTRPLKSEAGPAECFEGGSDRLALIASSNTTLPAPPSPLLSSLSEAVPSAASSLHPPHQPIIVVRDSNRGPHAHARCPA